MALASARADGDARAARLAACLEGVDDAGAAPDPARKVGCARGASVDPTHFPCYAAKLPFRRASSGPSLLVDWHHQLPGLLDLQAASPSMPRNK